MSKWIDEQFIQTYSDATTNFDQLCELVGPWNLHVKKLDKEKNFMARTDLFQSKDLFIIKSDFGGVLEQTGAPPEGMRTFWIPADDNQLFFWRKNIIDGKTVGIFPQGAELEATTKPGFKVYVISVPERLLVEEACKLGLDWSLTNTSRFKDIFVADSDIIYKFRKLLVSIFKLKDYNDLLGQQKLAFDSLKAQLIDLFIEQYLSSQIKFKSTYSNRTRIFNRFKEYINSDPSVSFSSSDLCSYVGASERTLEYVIKEFTQLTPNQYVKSLKLNMVRESLKSRDPASTKIFPLAMEFGFWHNSHFIRDYRSQFGELPSETLKKK